MAAKWMNQLEEHYPELAEKASLLNQRDNFVMRYDPALIKRQDDAKKARTKRDSLKSSGDDYRRRNKPSESSSDEISPSSSSSTRRDVRIENPSFVGMPKICDSQTETTSEESDLMSGETTSDIREHAKTIHQSQKFNDGVSLTALRSPNDFVGYPHQIRSS